MDDLKQKTFVAVFWSLLDRVGFRLINFIPTILLARLLSPVEFGLVGMLTVFILLAQTFIDSGFGAALIRKKDASHTDECSIFYFNILIGMGLVLLLYFAAPLIASFYAQPLLISLTRWLSFDILLKSFSLIQTTLLIRRLDFKMQLKANLIATLLGGLVGVIAAYFGLGVWSLVIQTLASSTLRTLSLWFLSSWRPSLLFSLSALKDMFGFGSNMLFSSLLATFFNNLYQIFIGKVFSASALGYYTRANSLKGITLDTTSSIFAQVLFPAMSSIQDDTERLHLVYRKAIRLITFVHFPLMLGLAATAAPLFNLLFSAKWAQSVLFFQLMCLAGVIYPLHLVNLEVLKVVGRSDLFFQLTFVKFSLMVVTIAITYRWGISAMLMGQIVNSFIAYFINAYYSKRLIDYSIQQQLIDTVPNLVLASLSALAMLQVGTYLTLPDWARLLTQLLLGGALYLLPNLFIRSEPLQELFLLAKRYLLEPIHIS